MGISEPRALRRLGAVSLGLLGNSPLRRMLRAHGFALGLPSPSVEALAVWGASATTARAEALARRWGKPVVYLEDAPLRSLHPQDRATVGFVLDEVGLPFGNGPSELTQALDAGAAAHPDAADLLALLRAYRLSKYNAWRSVSEGDLPRRFVLVCDQRRGDASIAASSASAADFDRMLEVALDANPGVTVIIRAHPRGQGHFEGRSLPDRVTLSTDPLNPWEVLERAEAVYAVASQLGQEAIFAGHHPHLFGVPHYAGRGLSDDAAERQVPPLTAEQLFSVTHLTRPRWFDPQTGAACGFEQALIRLDGSARHARATARPMGLSEIRLWKRARVKAILEATGAKTRFVATPAVARQRGLQPVVWASRVGRDRDVWQLEDGVIRSAGLGAALVPALSLTLDHRGIAFDATTPSDLEARCAAAPALPTRALARAQALRADILRLGITKYGAIGAGATPASTGAVLVVGQVADDASVLRGGGEVKDNAALLHKARAAFPSAELWYRPHPDVVAGLRPGTVAPDVLRAVDAAETSAPLSALWPRLAGVVTMTSTLGFEALLRGLPVTCFGWPFYAGWGLTNDLAPPLPPGRRGQRLSLDQLVHAVLIESALYYDPVTRKACGPEEVVARIASQTGTTPGVALRLLSKLQGVFASTPFWR